MSYDNGESEEIELATEKVEWIEEAASAPAAEASVEPSEAKEAPTSATKPKKAPAASTSKATPAKGKRGGKQQQSAAKKRKVIEDDDDDEEAEFMDSESEPGILLLSLATACCTHSHPRIDR